MNKNSVWIGLFIILTVWLADSNARCDDLVTQGKTLYTNNCQICHGQDGKGDGPAAAALDPKPADYTKATFWKSDAAKTIAETIKNGKSPMPAFDFDEASIKAVIAYLEKTFKPAGVPNP